MATKGFLNAVHPSLKRSMRNSPRVASNICRTVATTAIRHFLKDLLSNLKLLPDYTRLELNGETWLFVGGAVSVNRIDKIQCGEWWSREGFRLDPSRAGPADVLVTHSGPNWIGPGFSSPLIKTYAQAEDEYGTSSLVADLKEERRQHDRLFRLVKPRTWYLGHFHQKAEKQNAGCRVRILDCGELVRHSPP